MRFGTTALIAATLAVSGCHTMPTRSPPELAQISDVLNELKDELNYFIATPPTVTPNLGACFPSPGKMDLTPLSATVTLKAVAGAENDPSVGLLVPIGAFALDPSYSGAYSTSRTQTVVIPLAIPNVEVKRPIEKGNHPLGSALAAFRDQILKVDHARTPCLQYGDKAHFKLSIAFDAVKKSTGGIGLQLVVFKISDKETVTSEAHQTLDIELGLTPGGSLLFREILPFQFDLPPK